MPLFFGRGPTAHNPTGGLRHVRWRTSILAGGWLYTTEQYRRPSCSLCLLSPTAHLTRPIAEEGALDCSNGWQSFDFRMLAGLEGFVANFVQQVIPGQLPLSVRRLRGERVELF